MAARAGGARALSAATGREEADAPGSGTPVVSVVVPTAGRADYLEVALASISPQAVAIGAEVVVVLDGGDPASGAVARRHGARVVRLPHAPGLNAARNAGIAAARAPLVALADDDLRCSRGWLDALLSAAREHPEASVLGGPIHASLEGRPPRACGRESPPITTLDLGPEDRDVETVFGGNMLVRRTALDTAGPFDPRIADGGDEEEWLARVRSGGGQVRYVAGAGVEHRRAGADARLRALCRVAWARGRAAQRWDARRGSAPALSGEARVLAGCLWHAVRRRCGIGLVMAAHSAGRVREALGRRR